MRLLCIYLLLFFALPAYALTTSPQDQVKQMVDGVFEVLNSDLDKEEKKAQISGTVQKFLGVKSLSQRTLGVFWKKGTAEELDQFMPLYVRILERTYLNRVDDYSGGKVEYLKERVKGNKAILDTRFVSEKFDIPVQYKLVKKNADWQIYDVSIEGVSLVRSYRSSYNEILRKEGFDGLLSKMNQKLAQMEKAD
jgi:phospholipid transport system substrate-binding protein